MRTPEVRRFRRSLRRLGRLTRAQLRECCTVVTFAQCIVLLEVDEHGTPTMGQLAAQLRLDNSTLSRTIAGLVDKGYVERRHDDADRRTVRIALTPQGRTVCAAIHRDNDASCRGVLEHIPAAQRKAVIESFETLVEAFLAHEAERTPCG